MKLRYLVTVSETGRSSEPYLQYWVPATEDGCVPGYWEDILVLRIPEDEEQEAMRTEDYHRK